MDCCRLAAPLVPPQRIFGTDLLEETFAHHLTHSPNQLHNLSILYLDIQSNIDYKSIAAGTFSLMKIIIHMDQLSEVSRKKDIIFH